MQYNQNYGQQGQQGQQGNQAYGTYNPYGQAGNPYTQGGYNDGQGYNDQQGYGAGRPQAEPQGSSYYADEEQRAGGYGTGFLIGYQCLESG
jgi:hypothetical protein